MENHTHLKDFYLIGFSSNANNQQQLFVAFFLIYIIGVIWNLIITLVVYIDSHLHTPMYIFLSNLSFVDICYTTTTLPKLMDILLSGNPSISFTQCFTQFYFFVLIGSTEIVMLSVMAYDRYVAICNPLQYHIIMKKEKCMLFLGSCWISGCANAFLYTGFATKLQFCHSKKINHFYCEPRALTKLSCTDTGFYIIIPVETFLFLLFPFLFNLISYYKIISSILSNVSVAGRKKAFSTCTSHLSVITIFYGSMACVFGKPLSEHAYALEKLFSVVYAAVTPMLNPLIYSLRNKDVKDALKRIFGNTFKGTLNSKCNSP